MNGIVLVKKDGNHQIIDEYSGCVLVTIHTSEWTCTKEETEFFCQRILQSFKLDINDLCDVRNEFDFCTNCGFC